MAGNQAVAPVAPTSAAASTIPSTPKPVPSWYSRIFLTLSLLQDVYRYCILEPIGYLAFNIVRPRIRASAYRYGRRQDMDTLIKVDRAAISLYPVDHPKRSVASFHLGVDLSHNFDLLGHTEDREESTRALRESLSQSHPDQPHYSEAMLYLARNLQLLFRHVLRPEILDESISYARQVLSLRPLGHPGRQAVLRLLSEGLRLSYTQLPVGQEQVLDEAVKYAREALDLCPQGHDDRNLALHNMSCMLMARFKAQERMEDVDEAIIRQQEALVLLIGPRTPERPTLLYDLALSLWARYEKSRRDEGEGGQTSSQLLEQIVQFADKCQEPEMLRIFEAVSGHPAMTRLWTAIAPAYLLRPNADRCSLEHAFRLYAQAVNHPNADAMHRFEAAATWAGYARAYHHESAHRAYLHALRLVDECLLSRPSVEWQREVLIRADVKDLASAAASYFIQEDNLELAVEVLEQGRARLWSKLRGYRQPIDIEKLRTAFPELANRFENICSWLNEFAMSPLQSIDQLLPTPRPANENNYEYALTGQRILSKEWDETTREIQAVDGFTMFLQAEPFSYLREAAAEWPVIIVNVHPTRSDAIIVRRDHDPVLVPLSKDLSNIVANLTEDLLKITNRQARYTKPYIHAALPIRTNNMPTILESLWTNICEPVVDHLLRASVPEQSRIWWCPTGALSLFPIHAAGAYDEPNKRNLPDTFISSYTSTLKSIISAQNMQSSHPRLGNDGRILVVGQSRSLGNVTQEIENIQKIFGADVDVRDNDVATPYQVLVDLKVCPWVHFACHGSLNPTEPFKSSFKLHNDGTSDANEGRLSLLQIARVRPEHAELAFLAACDSAAGDSQGSTDEGLSLAGSLQFCGFQSVVGTLWAMSDKDGPDLAQDFYEGLKNEGRDHRMSAVALHRAVKKMRDRGVPLERWSTFIHIGI